MRKQSIPELTEGLIELQQKYAYTYRKIVTKERHHQLVEKKRVTAYALDDVFVREPLLEHVGHTPIIATYLHPHIAHRDEVNLGRSLIMLAVHDIGETKVGDMLTYAKTKSHEVAEFEAAKELLPDYLYAYFEEIERADTMDGKFAKSVDSIAPLLHEMAIPEILHDRLSFYDFSIEKIIERKTSHFSWDPVLEKMFDYLIEKYRHIEAQK